MRVGLVGLGVGFALALCACMGDDSNAPASSDDGGVTHVPGIDGGGTDAGRDATVSPDGGDAGSDATVTDGASPDAPIEASTADTGAPDAPGDAPDDGG